MTRTESDGPPSPLVFNAVGPVNGGQGENKMMTDQQQQLMSWSQRSTSMPSLSAIDELGSFNRLSSRRSPTADGGGGGASSQVRHHLYTKKKIRGFLFFSFFFLSAGDGGSS